MPAYAQIITHTSEQTAEWRSITATNPGRVVRLLRLSQGRTTIEGDDQGDIYPAMEVVNEILAQGQDESQNHIWGSLVDAGIVDALCKNVCSMVLFLHHLPNMPEDLLERVKQETRSPYYAPLEVLCNATLNFQYPPTETDKKVISSLRNNWSKMMDRIWNEPVNTLRPEESHTQERLVVAQIVIKLILADSAFLSTLYKPSDLTIQIVARHWKFAQKPPDTFLTSLLLFLLLEPKHPRHDAYVRSNDLESKTSHIMSRILVGIEPKPLSSKQQQAKALIMTFAEHLLRLSGRSLAQELEFFRGVFSICSKDSLEPEVVQAVFKSTPLWNAIFRVLKKSSKPTPFNDRWPKETEDPDVEKADRLRAISNITIAAANVLRNASLYSPTEREVLVRMWANENFFGAVEEIIEVLVTIPGMTMLLSHLTSLINTTISQPSSALVSLLRTQFPRWKLLGTLVKHDLQKRLLLRVTDPLPVLTPNNIPPADSYVWDQTVWRIFSALQHRCRDKLLCGRRSCLNAGTVECARCKVVKYCSEGCKNKDQKDHGIACLFSVVLDATGSEAFPNVAESRSPTRALKDEQLLEQAQNLDVTSPVDVDTLLKKLDKLDPS